MSTDDSSVAITPKQVLGTLAAVAIVVSGFLEWVDFTGVAGSTGKGTDVPAEFLVNKATDSTSPSILLLLAIAAALIGIGVLIPGAHRFSTIVGAVGAIVVAVLFCMQVQRSLDGYPSSLGAGNFPDYVSVGAYLALVGGIVGIVAALIPSRSGAVVAPPAAPPPAPAA
jgi:hypothetical protein